MPVLRGVQGRCGDGYCGGGVVGAVVGLRLPAVIQPTMLLSCVASAATQGTVEVPTAEVTLRPAVGCWQGRVLLVFLGGIAACVFWT